MVCSFCVVKKREKDIKKAQRSEHVARLEFKVFVDDGYGKPRRRGEQCVDAVLLKRRDDEAFLVFEFLGDGALIERLDGVGCWVRGVG